MAPISPSGMRQSPPLARVVTMASPCRSTWQPRCRRISIATEISVRWGQLWIIESPQTAAAARMGRAEFFAPWIASVPVSRFPPRIM